jgi:hypothetical protein
VAILERLSKIHPTGPLFRNRYGNAWQSKVVSHHLAKLAARSGCPHVTPHQLRSLWATDAIAAGVPVMKVYAAMCELPNFLFRSWARRHPQEPNSVLILDLDACISDRAPQRWARFHERAVHMDRLVRQRTWAWQAAHALKHRLAAEGVRLANCILSFVVAPITPPPALPSQCRHCCVEFDSCAEVVRHLLSATAHKG